ncbi:hypothetical protein Dsin_002425 [Dipteronia sinensis]|uniref:Reverse transcriptase domain-containing protein n=1 Tax=Dipteronia sinensis TaxID=43782 RepID=A0AAE0EJN9_9ROSI|nr:hypothetical protein Dsin_002425 [Dipteronia sinensis]
MSDVVKNIKSRGRLLYSWNIKKKEGASSGYCEEKRRYQGGWLMGVLGEVVAEAQCAFIPGRLISDNMIVSFECLYRIKCRKRKVGSMTIKLDMSKAYDLVE